MIKSRHFLREMRELARDKVNDTVLKELFLAQLPKSVAEILDIVEAKDLDSMAKGADRGVTRVEGEVATASASSTPINTAPRPEMETLMKK